MFFNKGQKVVDLANEHLEAVTKCYNEYEMAMKHILNGCTREEISNYNDKLKSLETEADYKRHQVLYNMLEGGLLVDSRKSLMRIIEKTDQVADLAEDIVGMMYQEQVEIFPEMIEPILKINEITRIQLELLTKSIKQVIYKFDMNVLIEDIHQIEKLESKVDDEQVKLMEIIFNKDMDLARKLHIKQLVTLVASISDWIEDVSDAIEIVMLTRKV